MSVKDRADEQFIGELRFTTNRMFSVSTLIGANIAFFAYSLVLRKMKVYVSFPMTLAIYLLSRNLVMKNNLDRIYLPMESVFNEIR